MTDRITDSGTGYTRQVRTFPHLPTPSTTDELNDVLRHLNHVARHGATKAERQDLRDRIVTLLTTATEAEFQAGLRYGRKAAAR